MMSVYRRMCLSIICRIISATSIENIVGEVLGVKFNNLDTQ